MKILMDQTLHFWVDAAREHIKAGNAELSRRQLVVHILREYERRGDALRCLDKRGRITWKASPQFTSALADAERDAVDDLDDWP
jgi:hypothetical protein